MEIVNVFFALKFNRTVKLSSIRYSKYRSSFHLGLSAKTIPNKNEYEPQPVIYSVQSITTLLYLWQTASDCETNKLLTLFSTETIL